MGTRSEELAGRFEKAVDDFATTVEGCSDAQWRAACGTTGWNVAQTAQHVSGQFPLEREYIVAAAEGSPMPSYSMDDINSKNDGRAAANAGVSKADVLKELRDGAASLAAYIRGLSDAQLDRKSAVPLAGGAELSTQQVLESGFLIDHLREHNESIRAAM